LARDSHRATCDRLLHAAIETSRAYHDLLGDLEAADIGHDTKLHFRVQKLAAQALLNRDDGRHSLRDHERTHETPSLQ
jgi:hypothetical protein